MRVLIIGSGGREHALSWKIQQSPLKPEIFIAPGNGGTAEEGRNVPIADNDIPALTQFILDNAIDFVIPGPEAPLVAGIADACRAINVPCFGPCAYAAQLEGSKVFSKTLMQKAGVPTADFRVFTDYDEAVAYVEACNRPQVIKADGLAAGKGVIVAANVEEAKQALHDMLKKEVFGAAGKTVLVEEMLVGEEASFLAFCDGETIIPLPSAQDHKAVFDGDQGPNTGGMGAYSPAPILPEQEYEHMMDIAMRPILRELKAAGYPFTGILYAGLMMTEQGPQVLEYNVRFGDPECQPLLMRLEGDVLSVMLAAAEHRLHEVQLPIAPQTALCVVITAEGYPGEYAKNMPIKGIAEAERMGGKDAHGADRCKVFQAGTKLADGILSASGGRILGITALGDTLADAQRIAYTSIQAIDMPHMHYRKDIGNKGLQKTEVKG